LLPALSCLSVSGRPGRCLRRRCSSGSLRISPLHPEFHVPLRPSRRPVFTALAQLSQALSPQTKPSACAPFTPSNSGQRSPPTYYRGCWHVVSRGFFLGYRPGGGMTRPRARPPEKRFTPRKASSRTRRCSVRVAPIAEDSSLLPPVGVWAVLNPSVADHPLRPATDRRLGRPLPPQLANRPRTPPRALPRGLPRNSFGRTARTPRPYAVLAGISAGYPPPQGRSSTCSAPVRHWSHLRRGNPRPTCMCYARRQRLS
jgi:hypothetical protein